MPNCSSLSYGLAEYIPIPIWLWPGGTLPGSTSSWHRSFRPRPLSGGQAQRPACGGQEAGNARCRQHKTRSERGEDHPPPAAWEHRPGVWRVGAVWSTFTAWPDPCVSDIHCARVYGNWPGTVTGARAVASRTRHPALLSAASRAQVHPLGQRAAPWPQASEHLYQHRANAAEDWRLRSGSHCRPTLLAQGKSHSSRAGVTAARTASLTRKNSTHLNRYRNNTVVPNRGIHYWLSVYCIAV